MVQKIQMPKQNEWGFIGRVVAITQHYESTRGGFRIDLFICDGGGREVWWGHGNSLDFSFPERLLHTMPALTS